MREIEISKNNLEIFISNLRKQDREELLYFLGKNYKTKLINTILENKKNTYLLSYKSLPSCIGGIYYDKLGAQLWLLCAENYDKKYLLSYVKEKILKFQNENIFLYNYIYKSNFKFLNFLKKLNFEVSDLKNPNIKLFYYKRRKN